MMEKERLLNAEIDVEHQSRKISTLRTHSRLKRASYLLWRTDVRNTKSRDKAFAASTRGRDITRSLP